MNRVIKPSFFLLTVAWLLVACGDNGGGVVPTIDMAAVQTYTVQTAAVALTLTRQAASPTPRPSATLTAIPSETPLPTETPLPPTEPVTTTVQPTPTMQRFVQTPIVSIGAQIEEDDFEHGQTWYSETADNYRFFYDQGGYRIRNGPGAGMLHSVRSLTVEDTALEVDANALASPEGSYWGVVCRYAEDKGYYAFLIGPDGAYGIGKMKGGQFKFIARDTVVDKAIFKPDDNNFVHIRGDCVGETLTLYANNVKMLEVIDDEYTSGSIGLVVRHGTNDIWVDILFDNYSLSQPGAKKDE